MSANVLTRDPKLWRRKVSIRIQMIAQAMSP